MKKPLNCITFLILACGVVVAALGLIAAFTLTIISAGLTLFAEACLFQLFRYVKAIEIVEIACVDCGEKFYVSESELEWLHDKGLDPFKRCRDCREKRRITQNGL